jgi:gluconate 2-dehydrogenase gamma chain
MHRREALRVIGAAAAALPFLPARADAAARVAESVHRKLGAERARPGASLRVLSAEQNELVTMIAEMIIPETDTPGATTVRVNEFVDLLLAEWYSDAEKARFLAGLDAIDRESKATYGRRFVELAEPERVLTLRALDGARESSEGAGNAFGELKRLTVYAYFTSEPVQKNVLKTVMWPGRFDGCVDVPSRTTGAGSPR